MFLALQIWKEALKIICLQAVQGSPGCYAETPLHLKSYHFINTCKIIASNFLPVSLLTNDLSNIIACYSGMATHSSILA